MMLHYTQVKKLQVCNYLAIHAANYTFIRHDCATEPVRQDVISPVKDITRRHLEWLPIELNACCWSKSSSQRSRPT